MASNYPIMDNTTSQTHLPSPPHYNPVRNEYDGVWEPYGQPNSSSIDAVPTQAPPFFQTSPGTFPSGARYGMIPMVQSFSAVPASNAQYGSMSIPSHPRPDSSKPTTRPRGRPSKPKTSRNEPSSKRQKTSTEPSTNKRILATYAGQDESSSASQSSCCSSCSEGEPCAAPGCDGQKIAVVPCTEQGCEQPVCIGSCLIAPLHSRQVTLEQRLVPSASRLSTWDNTTWTPEVSRPATQMNADSPESKIDPVLMALSDPKYAQTVSPAPTTPPIEENNLPTPYCSNNALTTPQSNYHPQSTHPNDSAAIVQGTGTQWQSQYYDPSNTGNEFSMFYCPWEGCQQLFPSQDVWTSHFHEIHLDPQITYPCLLQAETCQPTMGSNPLDHLEADHGYHFDMNSGGLSCPAPACPPGETFCNPAMLHNHFDHAHAMPAQGSLRCQLNTCNTLFEDSQQFFTHISERHSDAVPIPKEDDIDLNSPVEMVKSEAGIPKLELPNEERPHDCRWRNDDGAFCGLACKSEDELQTHVKNEHLAHMAAKSGYICQWEGCKRLEKRGEKLGFSQRGKLERHMSTHTGYKCCTCTTCGDKFSAPQSLAQHVLIHTGEKPWKCKHCDKAFPQQSACTIHERTHTGEKPLKCDFCDKRFSESSNLAKHRKTHGEKGLHACPMPNCGKSFHRLDQLKRHRLVHEKKLQKAGTYEPSDASGTVVSSSATETDSGSQ